MRDYFSFKAKEILGKKPVKKGEVILTSQPFAYVIDGQHRGGYCDNCIISHKLKTLKPCKNCDFVWYCSEHCYWAAHDIHQYECKALKKIDPYIPESFARLLFRAIIKLKNGGEKYVENYSEKKTRKFKDLMNHYRDIKSDEKRMQDVRQVMKELGLLMGDDAVPPEADFIGLYGRILVNRFCLMDAQLNAIGSAVYLSASIFDHSCRPNAYASFEGKNVVIRSLIDWKELDLNKVFISYLDLLSSTFYRRAELRANWYFWCYCPLCSDKDRIQFENCMKCENPECLLPVLVPEKPDSLFIQSSGPEPECGYCGWTVSEDRLEEYHSAVAYTRQRLKGLKETNPAMDLCLSVLEKQADIFSSMNIWRVKALDCAFNAAYFNGVFSSAIEYGRSNLEAMKIYYGPSHPTFGLFLMKLGKCLLYLKQYKEGLTHVKESESILKIALGPKHQLIVDEIRNLKVMANEDLEIYLENRIAQKDQDDHELVCKHCGRKKKQAKEHKEPEPEKPKSKKEDIYELIAMLDDLIEKRENGESRDSPQKENKRGFDTYITTLRENGIRNESKGASRKENEAVSAEANGTKVKAINGVEASTIATHINGVSNGGEEN
ncbi:UNVERIFIED_CONTAM: hypothetical protein RMT77_000777 [Armadillidium vulgare]